MSKYIDSEKLIAEIERLHKSHSGKYGCDEVGVNLEYLEDFIASLQQEQPKSKIVKVRCVFPFDETWEKDKIYTCKVWHHGDLNHDFWDVYYDYEKDPKYVQFPTIELLNEEFAIIQEESHVKQEQTEVDLDEEITRFWKKEKESGQYIDTSFDTFVTLQHIAYHFANWQKEQDDKVKI